METFDTAAASAGLTPLPPALVELLACPRCTSTLLWDAAGARCARCERVYRRLASGVPVLLPDEALAYEPEGRGRAMKAHVRERFDDIERALPPQYESFVTFLNLGYVPTDAQQHAARGPSGRMFNRFSTQLLFEVIGGCTLDGHVVFDLGAGRGGNIAMIQQYYQPRAIVGLDLSTTNVEFCQRHQVIANGGFVVGDVECLPVRDAAADVVLNLESSHYYPHLERFFDEVDRTLRPGGAFLYADILPAPVFDAAATYLGSLGFDCLRDQDISENVLRSCEAIGALRQNARHANLYDTFTVVPGSPDFEALRTGRTRYKIWTLGKPAARTTSDGRRGEGSAR